MPVVFAFPGDDLNAVVEACVNPGPNNVYEVKLHDGNYDLSAFMNNASTDSPLLTSCLNTRDYVNISAVNNTYPEPSVTIEASRADGSLNYELYELISWNSITNLTGLKITCRNMRYPIHNGRGAAMQIVENCVVNHLGNWKTDGTDYDYTGFMSCCPIGAGQMVGGTYLVRNSTLIGRSGGWAFGAHNYLPTPGSPSLVKAENCILRYVDKDGNPEDGGLCVFAQNIGQNPMTDHFQLVNCSLNGYIGYSLAPWAAPITSHSGYDLYGYGNTGLAGFINLSSDAHEQDYRYTGEEMARAYYNSTEATILRGSLCVFEGDGVRPMVPEDCAANYCQDAQGGYAGVAMYDIPKHGRGFFQHKLNIQHSFLRITGTPVQGDALSIDPANPGALIVSLQAPAFGCLGEWNNLNSFYPGQFLHPLMYEPYLHNKRPLIKRRIGGRMYANSVSSALAVDTNFQEVTYASPLRAIQNTTGGDLHVKLGGGNGEIIIPDKGFFEPLLPLACTVEVKSTQAGDIVLVQ